MHVERHIFGSHKGYTTLAKSSGVSSDESRFLEGGAYQFGQPSDRKFAKTLRSSPAYFTRTIRGGKRALTRVLEGAEDEGGRPTLLMVSAILSQQDWDVELGGDVAALLRDTKIWEWRAGDDLPAIDLPPPAMSTSISKKSAAKVLQLISQIEQRMPRGGAVIVAADEFAIEDFRAVEMLIPPSAKTQFSSAFRSLSPELPSSLNGLAGEATNQRLTYRFDPAVQLSPYAMFLQQSGLSDGRLPITDAMTYARFGKISAPTAGSAVPSALIPPPPPPARNAAKVLLISVLGTLIVLIAVVCFVLELKKGKAQVAANADIVPIATVKANAVRIRGNLSWRLVSFTFEVDDPNATQHLENVEGILMRGFETTQKLLTENVATMTANARRTQQPESKPTTTTKPAGVSQAEPSSASLGEAAKLGRPPRPNPKIKDLFESARVQFFKFLPTLGVEHRIEIKDGESDKLVKYLVESAESTITSQPENDWMNSFAVLTPLQQLFGACEKAEKLLQEIDDKSGIKPEERSKRLENLDKLQNAISNSLERLAQLLQTNEVTYVRAKTISDRIKKLQKK